LTYLWNCIEQAFLVLNIPSIDYLDSLLDSLPATLFPQIKDASLRTIFYFLGPNVLADPRLKTWISTLPSTLEHQISSADHMTQSNPVLFAPAALLSLRLSELSQDIFRLPHYSYLPDSTEGDHALLPQGTFPEKGLAKLVRPSARTYLGSKKNGVMLPFSTAMTPASTLSTYVPLDPTAPKKKKMPKEKGAANIPSNAVVGGSVLEQRYFNFPVPSIEADLAAAKMKGDERPEAIKLAAQRLWEEYLVEAKRAREAVEVEQLERDNMIESERMSTGENAEGRGIRITPLGTGSAVPSKYRNVSSTLIHLPPSSPSDSTSSSMSMDGEGFAQKNAEDKEEKRYILLDAGEGTWGQIARRFGSEGDESSEVILRGLKCIFISHMHQDHHMGIATILKKRSEVRSSSSLFSCLQ
jgi:ribonuclease Z